MELNQFMYNFCYIFVFMVELSCTKMVDWFLHDFYSY